MSEIAEGMIAGARNLIGLAAAMGVAGILVGAVTLTGIGQVMAEFVEFSSGGNLLAMLFFVALISIILGMGLPTTANYIVVSSLMAGVVVELGAQKGLIVPLIAVQMLVFYFGIMADVTPPVGLASFAAAAISKADPLKTEFQAFFYSIRGAVRATWYRFRLGSCRTGCENRSPPKRVILCSCLLSAWIYLLAPDAPEGTKGNGGNRLMQHILCSVDLSDEGDAQKILIEADKLAGLYGAKLSVVTVLPDYGSSFVGSFFKEGTLKQAAEAAMETLHRLTKSAVKNDAKV